MKILFIASKRIKVLEEVKMGLKVLYKSNPFFKEEIQKRSPNKSTRGAVPKRATERAKDLFQSDASTVPRMNRLEDEGKIEDVHCG